MKGQNKGTERHNRTRERRKEAGIEKWKVEKGSRKKIIQGRIPFL